MIMEREEQIRCLAYNIWEQEGYPHGRHIDHWLTAETIWQTEHRQEDSEKQVKPSQQKRAKRSRSVRPNGLVTSRPR